MFVYIVAMVELVFDVLEVVVGLVVLDNLEVANFPLQITL